jgi:hypothetical protein
MTGDECSCAACRRDAEPPEWKPEPYVSDYERGFAAGFRVGFEEGRKAEQPRETKVWFDGPPVVVDWEANFRDTLKRLRTRP